MEINIIEYNPALAGTLAKMWNDSRENWGGGNDTKTPGQVAQRIEGSAILHHYVAMAGDEAVGYGSLGRYFGDADALYIELLSVRPDYQGKKVGKALVLQCVQRTIELGYPRLDIHTWSGNTDATPLYKKCGYLWEDRPDSVHMVNFIPEILGTALFKPYFEKADWYADSTRALDIVPDGVKVNKFEVFGYHWEKDGEMLAIGYERTGRRTRLIETNDYKIEMMADSHEPAFGLDYGVAFDIVNKSGAPLRVKINGRDDRNISFNFNAEEEITGTRRFAGTFHVGEISEPQDKWKVHPCVLAAVEINGQPVTFGLGICTKYPLEVTVTTAHTVQQIGMQADAFVNITSSLGLDAEVAFSLAYDGAVHPFTAKLAAGVRTALPVTLAYRTMGYHPTPTTFDITLADGKRFAFTKPLHLVAQDLTHAFYGAGDTTHFIVNGPWRVTLDTAENDAAVTHLTNPHFSRGWFTPPKLGKPFEEEFNLMTPAISGYMRGRAMVLEARYLSEKFPGMAVTSIFTLDAVGIVSHHYKIENLGNTAREVFLNDSTWLPLVENYTTFKYRGQFTQNHDGRCPDGVHDALDAIDPHDVEENWAFEADPAGGIGCYWPPTAKPGFQWGNFAIIETPLGEMQPGEAIETAPLVCVYGLFNNFGDFRNYVRQECDKTAYLPTRRVELKLNGHNPFVFSTESITLDAIQHREVEPEGTITVTSPVYEKTVVVSGAVDAPLAVPVPAAPEGIIPLTIRMDLDSYAKTYARVLFTPRGTVEETRDGTRLQVTNGAITFCADPAFGQVCYSLTTADGCEWLTHQYPERKPFAWFNPFLGGIRIMPQHMNNVAILKEKISADFAQVMDNFGNTWRGICTKLEIQEDDNQRGAIYESYFVTQPGIPVLCAFYRIINGTGVYQRHTPYFDAFVQPADPGGDYHAEFINKRGEYFNLHFGKGGDMETYFENSVIYTSQRARKLHIFHANADNGKTNEITGDAKYPGGLLFYMECHAAPGETFTASPVFFIPTAADIPLGGLDGLAQVRMSVLD